MDATTIQAIESLIGTGPVGVAFVLILSALIWVTKSLLASNEREKELLRKENESLKTDKDNATEKMFGFIMTVSSALEKHTSFLEKHDAEAIRHRERIMIEVENIKREFTTLPCRFKGTKYS